MASSVPLKWSSGLERKGSKDFEGIHSRVSQFTGQTPTGELHKRNTAGSTFGTRSSHRVSEPKKGSQATAKRNQATEDKNDQEDQIKADTKLPIQKVIIKITCTKLIVEYSIYLSFYLVADRALPGCSGHTLWVATRLSSMAPPSALAKHDFLTANTAVNTRNQIPQPVVGYSYKEVKKKDAQHILRQQSSFYTLSIVHPLSPYLLHKSRPERYVKKC